MFSIEVAYFPSIGYFSSLKQYKSDIVLNDLEAFKKQTPRNRCQILSANGLQILSIPLQGGKTKLKTNEVVIDYSIPWQRNHWRAITSAYGKSPFFEYYSDVIKELIFFDSSNLFNYNLHQIEKLYQVISRDKINLGLLSKQNNPDILGLEDYFNPKSISNQVETFPSHQKKYQQCFDYKFGFVKGLSIIDLLFNVGDESYFFL